MGRAVGLPRTSFSNLRYLNGYNIRPKVSLELLTSTPTLVMLVMVVILPR